MSRIQLNIVQMGNLLKNLDGTHTVSGTYNGTLAEKTVPAMGWGAGASGGGGIISVGNILILPSTAPGKHDASHWQNVPYQQEMGKESHSFSHNHQHGDGANVLANTPADSTNSFHTDEHAIIVGQPHQPVHGHF
ncbi:hypothetical protein [Rugamonas rubra]|uniref:hypothetical protein n=1 Tax=Rugamonas rubra TaxID=758825 RepID=UPI0011138333|nr:hypothetical protein [Rugamonas rubra]